MNDEISKILQMLEAGTINAAEAERLIRAVGEAGGGPAGGESAHSEEARRPVGPNPFRDIQEIFRMFGEAQARAARRQCRCAHWQHYQWSRRQEEARRKRAETMDTAQRVRFVLTDRVVVDKTDFDDSATLRDLIHGAPVLWERPRRIAWDNLRYGLEYEFGMEISTEDVEKWDTVQSVVEYVNARLGLYASPAAQAEDAPKPKSPRSKAAPTEQPA